MLGEIHSLANDFPEFQDLIAKMIDGDEQFAADNKRYNDMDKRVRSLELNGSPISDDDMHQLKHDRAALKDELYQRLKTAS